MRHRTNSEIKAYVDGYTACFNQYSECLKNRKSVLDSKKKMEIYLAAVTGVLEATGNATNADRIRAMTDEELAEFLAIKIFSLPPCHLTSGSYWEEQPVCKGCEGCWLDWLTQEVQQ